MQFKKTLATLTVAGTIACGAQSAVAATVVTGGSATITFNADFDALGLGTSWDNNADGNPERDYVVRPAEGMTYDITFTRDGVTQTRTFTARESNQSLALDNDEALLRLSGRGIYLFATDSNGDEIETFDPVRIFSFREDDPSVTEEMRNINYVPTADANVFTDYSDPSITYTLTDHQVSLMRDSELRLCCAHTLGRFEINTADMTVDGVIDSISERDINFDGVIDENDEFHLFDLVDNGSGDSYDLALTDVMAGFLNHGFSAAGFADPTDFLANWGNAAGALNLQGGDVIGAVNFEYQVAPVPLPAGAVLLLSALGVMGAAGKRRARKSA